MKTRLIALVMVFVLVGALTACGLEVPRPEVKEGRFDIAVTYEIGGEVKTLNAVYVCEFDGTSWTLEGGYYSRDWKAHTEGDYEGDNNSAIIGRTEDGGEIMIFFGLYPEYFMGDPETGDMGIPTTELYVSFDEGNDSYSFISDPAEIYERYGVKLISYEYASPIENTFGLFK